MINLRSLVNSKEIPENENSEEIIDTDKNNLFLINNKKVEVVYWNLAARLKILTPKQMG